MVLTLKLKSKSRMRDFLYLLSIACRLDMFHLAHVDRRQNRQDRALDFTLWMTRRGKVSALLSCYVLQFKIGRRMTY
jgi:hypothetical protein